MATLSPAYYENPNWLINPTPQGAVSAVTASISGGNLIVSATGFAGSALVYVTAANGTQTFLVTFTDNAPTLTSPLNQSSFL